MRSRHLSFPKKLAGSLVPWRTHVTILILCLLVKGKGSFLHAMPTLFGIPLSECWQARRVHFNTWTPIECAPPPKKKHK